MNNKVGLTLRRSVLVTGSAALLAAPFGASAQADGIARTESPAGPADLIEVIVVTAAKREQNLQDVAVAITAIDGEQLANTGATDISDFVARAPGLAFQRADRSSNQLSIRGLTSFTRSASEFPMVGAYFDEVPISETSIPDIGLIDLERVEVLRGPQGTLYGEGSMGGTIKFISVKPNFEMIEGFTTAGASTTRSGGENYTVSGAVNLPLVEDLAAVRIAGFYEDDGGFVDNAGNGQEDEDAYERQGVRISVLVEPTDALSVNLTAMHQLFEGGIPSNVFPTNDPGLTPPGLTTFGDEVAYRLSPTFSEDEASIFNGVISYDFGFATLTSSTSYYDRERNGELDETTTARTVEAALTPLTTTLGLGPFVLTNGIQTVYASGNETFAQEVRLTSNDDTGLRYTVGAYYRTRDVFSDSDTRASDIIPLNTTLLGLGLSGNPDYAGELQIATADVSYRQYAVFGEATYAVTDQLDVTGGLRYFEERVRGDQTAVAIDASTPGPTFLTIITSSFPEVETTEDKTLWHFGASYHFADDLMAYLSAAQGFRPGGVNARANPTPGADSPLAFESDEVTSYEVGLKSQWFDGALTLNAAAYISDLSDAQFEDVRDGLFPVVRNAGGADISGLEFEALAALTRNLKFGATLSFLDAEFSQDALPFTTPAGDVNFIVLDGQALPVARDYSASVFADWRSSLSNTIGFTAYVDISYAGEAEVSTVRADTGAPGTFYTLDDYVLANAQVGLEIEDVILTLFIDNVSDEFVEYGGTVADGISRNKPRTIGLRARMDF
ncbi:TonB-dependent receptor [Exilibacterium tricleocarpae]|uniref:TonB-dependent receptor n=1 Tax=Exilibacterium tricleocarpae TaxID=2591008 RepID=A0A545U9H9_9GAMM|nr:TonB-dependent receptor [Exilibacterium tricleocarpae]TQV86128.1 TonB-dependent receptor [Exilibacterium tricleocarpae]